MSCTLNLLLINCDFLLKCFKYSWSVLYFQPPSKDLPFQQPPIDSANQTTIETPVAPCRHCIKLPKFIENSWLGHHLIDSHFAIPMSRILKVILWFILWGLFIELEFGAVYFVISLMFVIYFTMRSGSRKQGEPSAYSVFNPGCEQLDGTLTAEQFESELRYGALSVH